VGYEQHLFRSQEKKQISHEEYQDLIRTDDSLIHAEGYDHTIEWTGHPLGGIEGEAPRLFFGQGRISTRHPDEFVTKKMFELAEQLNASLGDDEGVFDHDHRQKIEESCKRILERVKREPKRSKWRFW
jgi:hypothetical protein